MKLKNIHESIFTSSMEQLVITATNNLRQLLNNQEYEDEGLAEGQIIDEYGRPHNVSIDVEFSDDEDDHLEAIVFMDDNTNYISITIDPYIDTSDVTIRKLIAHEVAHIVDKGPPAKAPKVGEKLDKYWASPSETNAEISAFVHFAIKDILHTNTPQELRAALPKTGFIEAIIKKYIDEWEEMFGFRASHLNHYLNNKSFKQKIMKHFVKLVDMIPTV